MWRSGARLTSNTICRMYSIAAPVSTAAVYSRASCAMRSCAALLAAGLQATCLRQRQYPSRSAQALLFGSCSHFAEPIATSYKNRVFRPHPCPIPGQGFLVSWRGRTTRKTPLARIRERGVRGLGTTPGTLWVWVAGPEFLFVLPCAAKPRRATQSVSDQAKCVLHRLANSIRSQVIGVFLNGRNRGAARQNDPSHHHRQEQQQRNNRERHSVPPRNLPSYRYASGRTTTYDWYATSPC